MGKAYPDTHRTIPEKKSKFISFFFQNARFPPKKLCLYKQAKYVLCFLAIFNVIVKSENKFTLVVPSL